MIFFEEIVFTGKTMIISHINYFIILLIIVMGKFDAKKSLLNFI